MVIVGIPLQALLTVYFQFCYLAHISESSLTIPRFLGEGQGAVDLLRYLSHSAVLIVFVLLIPLVVQNCLNFKFERFDSTTDIFSSLGFSKSRHLIARRMQNPLYTSTLVLSLWNMSNLFGTNCPFLGAINS